MNDFDIIVPVKKNKFIKTFLDELAKKYGEILIKESEYMPENSFVLTIGNDMIFCNGKEAIKVDCSKVLSNYQKPEFKPEKMEIACTFFYSLF